MFVFSCSLVESEIQIFLLINVNRHQRLIVEQKTSSYQTSPVLVSVNKFISSSIQINFTLTLSWTHLKPSNYLNLRDSCKKTVSNANDLKNTMTEHRLKTHATYAFSAAYALHFKLSMFQIESLCELY